MSADFEEFTEEDEELDEDAELLEAEREELGKKILGKFEKEEE